MSGPGSFRNRRETRRRQVHGDQEKEAKEEEIESREKNRMAGAEREESECRMGERLCRVDLLMARALPCSHNVPRTRPLRELPL